MLTATSGKRARSRHSLQILRRSLDFLSDTFGASRRFRILAVNDDCCRKNLCLMADTSISGSRVVRELDALVRVDGRPASIVSENILCREFLAAWVSRSWGIRCPG